MLSFKHGVRIRGISPELIVGWSVANQVFDKFGFDCMVTSCNDRHHSRGSRHYRGDAVDLRSKHVPVEKKRQIEQEVQRRLAPLEDFDFFLEAAGTDNEHYHLQFRPKGV
jgi:hypothetical protein